MPRKITTSSQPFTAIIAAGFVIGGLYLAKGLLVPLAVSILLAFLLAPLANLLERMRLGRIASGVVSVIVMLLPLVGMVALMGNQVFQLTADVPKYQANLRERADSISKALAGRLSQFENAAEQIEEVIEQPKTVDTSGETLNQTSTSPSPSHSRRPDQNAPDEKKKAVPEPVPVRLVQSTSLENVGNWLSPVLSPLGMLAMISVLVLFMLLEREDLRNRAILLVGRSNLPIATKAIDEAGLRVTRYLQMQLLVNSIYGVAVFLMVWLLGLPNPWFWGVIGMALRFIPYIGPWITAGGIFVLSLAVTPGWTVPLIVIGAISSLELIVNNVLEPWLYGSSAGLTSVAVIVAAVFWTWLWDAPGLFLSTPLTVCICVLGRYLPQFEFAAILLSDNPPLPAESRFYQRLLAVDDAEAKQVVEKALKAEGLESLFDKFLLPTLIQAEADYQSGDLETEQRNRVHAALLQTGENAVSTGDVEAQESQTDVGTALQQRTSSNGQHLILCVPGHGTADQVSAELAAQFLSAKNWESYTTSDSSLCSEILQQIEETQPEVILISSLTPLVDRHARYLCKRLRQRFLSTPVVIGLWATDQAKVPPGSQGGLTDSPMVVSSLAELRDKLENRLYSAPVKAA